MSSSASSVPSTDPDRLAAPQRILTKTLLLSLADVGARVLSLALYIVIARQLGQSAFGIFTLGMAVAVLITVLARFGQDVVLIREVARDRERIHAYFSTTILLKVAVAATSLAIASIVLAAAGMDASTRAVIVLLSCAFALDSLAATCFAVFQAFDRFALVPVVLITERLVVVAAAIPALFLGVSVVGVSAVYCGGALIGFAIALTALAFTVGLPRLSMDRHACMTVLRAALPVGVVAIIGELLFRVDTAMLAAFEPSAVVGEYGAAYRVLEATAFLGLAVAGASYPTFARFPSIRDPAVGSMFSRVLKLACAATLPIAVGASLLAGPVIRLLYGDGFSKADDALALLAPAFLFVAVETVTVNFLIARNYQRIVALIAGVILIENVFANLALIPLFSLKGAAAGTSISEGLLALALLVVVLRLRVHIQWRRALFGPCAASALMVPILLALEDRVLFALAAGALSYVVVLIVIERLAYPDDARMLLRVVHR